MTSASKIPRQIRAELLDTIESINDADAGNDPAMARRAGDRNQIDG